MVVVDVGGVRSSSSCQCLRKASSSALIRLSAGSTAVRGQASRAFTNFADQAVIAIENTRLLNELRQRTDDLSEALEQQTATADVLTVISSSTGELEPVFEAMLANAMRVCEATYGAMWLREDGKLRNVAFHGDFACGFLEHYGKPARRISLDSRWVPIARAVRSGRAVIIPGPEGRTRAIVEGHPLAGWRPLIFGGIRTLIAVPMLKEGEHVGGITIYRREVRPFSDKQVELVQNFAAQAVIAIENTRLLGELRQRTGDLSEALEQQTATSEVLQVISSSHGELKTVFEAVLANATRICAAKFGILWLREGEDAFRLGALHGVPRAFAEARSRDPVVRPGPRSGLGRIALTKQAVHIVDVTADQAYIERDPLRVALVEQAGARTFVQVPMLKEDKLIGTIAIYRQEVRPFTDKQIELVTKFAYQAVIAIENTRLLNELRESLQQQTATADVLKVISRSTFDLQTVLDTLVQSAARCVMLKRLSFSGATARFMVFRQPWFLFRIPWLDGTTADRYRTGHACRADGD